MSEEKRSEFGRWMAAANHTRTGTEYDWDDMAEAFLAGMETAEQQAAEREPDDPEPAKVIVVTETPASGLANPADRHFPEARGWEDFDDGRLYVFSSKARRIATYAPGRWMSVREDDAILSDFDPHAEADL